MRAERSHRPGEIVLGPFEVATGASEVQAFATAVGARAGGAPVLRAVARVTFWGAVAMAVTAVVGKIFGAVV